MPSVPPLTPNDADPPSRTHQEWRRTPTRADHPRIDETAGAGIAAKVFIIHGYPGENAQTTQDTIGLLRELRSSLNRVSLFRLVPLPGTQVYEHAAAHQIRGTHLQPDPAATTTGAEPRPDNHTRLTSPAALRSGQPRRPDWRPAHAAWQ